MPWVCADKNLPPTEPLTEFLITLDTGNERSSATANEAIKKNDAKPKTAPPAKSALGCRVILGRRFFIIVRIAVITKKLKTVTIKNPAASEIPFVKEKRLTRSSEIG